MKIAYVTPYAGEQTIVTELLSGHDVVYHASPIGESDGVPETLRDADVLALFVNSRLTSAMIDQMPKLKHIALRSTGFDHVDTAHAATRNIAVSYVPHYGSQTVAEHTFALILTLSRKIHSMHNLLRVSGEVDIATHEGFDLSGKTIGVIGTGAIGKRVCEIAHGFRMRIRAFDIFPDQAFADKFGITYGSLEEVLSESDIVTLHVPSTAQNFHILNEDTIAKTKPGAYIINTARGSLIDTIALVHALKSDHLAGAGLDVYEGEEFLKDELKLIDTREELNMHIWRAFAAEHELLDMQSVVMTPHMAFNTREAKREITETTLNNILKWSNNEPFFAVKSE